MWRSTDALRTRARGRRIVLGLDDAQLLDPVSAALVLHLTQTGSAFVVATVRTGEPCPDAIVSLWKDAGARRMELGALARRGGRRPARGSARRRRSSRPRCAGSSTAARATRSTCASSCSAPSSRARSRRERGLWRLTGRPPVTRTLVELVAQRMSGLARRGSRPGRGARGRRAAAGRRARRADATSRRSSRPSTLGLVVVEADQVRLAHPLYGEVVRAELPVLRARALRITRRGPAAAARAAHVRRRAARRPPAARRGRARSPPSCSSTPRAPRTWPAIPALGCRSSPRPRSPTARDSRPRSLLARAHTVRKRYADAEAVLARAAPLAGPDDAGMRLPRAARARALLGPRPPGRTRARCSRRRGPGRTSRRGSGGSSRCAPPTRR